MNVNDAVQRGLLPGVWRVTLSVFVAALPAAAAEELTVRDTDYPVPTSALFVATDGSDGNPGTRTEPLRTIGAAVEQALPDATIVIRGGTYREGDYIFDKPLTLQPFPHETVWLKGSRVVSEWVPVGSYWRHDDWPYRFEWNSYEPGAIDPAYPHAGKPDMVFVDGQPLAQVGSVDELSAGTFYVDYATSQLYVGTDPAGRTVEAAANEQALRAVTSSADGTRIRGLGFVHYGGHRFAGTLQCDGARVLFENNTVAWGASSALTIYNSKGTVVRGNTFENNGLMGLTAWRTRDLRAEGNRLAGNNQERFVLHGPVAEASGSKITESRRLVIRDNVIEDNLATGLWLDISIYEATIVGNTVRTNASFGIFYEISARGIIAGNLVVANQDAGIALSNSSTVHAYNNTLVDNVIDIAVFDDDRVNGDADEVALGITWIAADVTFKNNILSNTDGSAPLLYARDFNSVPLKDADEMFRDIDFNAYYRTESSHPSVLVEWWRGVNYNGFEQLEAFRVETGLERSGLAIDDVPESPFFVNEAGGDYRLFDDSVARGAGAPLPVAVAAALGLPPGVPVDLGAIQYVETRDGD